METPTDAASDDRLVLGLMDVLDLIAPGARAHGWTALPSTRSQVHDIAVTMPSGSEVHIIIVRHPTGTTREAALAVGGTLERLRKGPVPAPDVLWLDPDGVVFGVPAMALTRLQGTPGVDHDALAWAASLAATLADVHLFAGELLPHLPIVATAEEVTPDAVPVAGEREAQVLAVLRDHAPDVGFEESRLVHGRLGPTSVLSTGDAITGLVDWRGARRGDPRIDVGAAHALTWLTAGPEAAEALREAYAARTGRSLDHLAWFGLAALGSCLGDQLDGIDDVNNRLRDYLDWALAAAAHDE